MSGIYASLRQVQILVLEIVNKVWMPVPLYLSGMANPDYNGTPSLILNPAISGKHFETILYCMEKNEVDK